MEALQVFENIGKFAKILPTLQVSFPFLNDGASYVAVGDQICELWGLSPVTFVRGHFQEIGKVLFCLRLKPRQVENVSRRMLEKVS